MVVTFLTLQVLSIIEKYFSDHCIQEHLRLAVSSMESGDEVFSPLSPQVGQSDRSCSPGHVNQSVCSILHGHMQVDHVPWIARVKQIEPIR